MPHGLLVAETGQKVAQHAWPSLAVDRGVAVFSEDELDHGPWGWCEPEPCGSFRPWPQHDMMLPCFKRIVYEPDTLSEMVRECLARRKLVVTQPLVTCDVALDLMVWCWDFDVKFAMQLAERGPRRRRERVRDLLKGMWVTPILLNGWFYEAPYTALIDTSEAHIEAARAEAEAAGASIVEQW